MYIESKAAGDGGPARIGFVAFSKTGVTIRHGGQSFRRIRGGGVWGNYADVETGDEYWISGPKRDGDDRLFGALPITIDENARETYWREVRGRRGGPYPGSV